MIDLAARGLNPNERPPRAPDVAAQRRVVPAAIARASACLQRRIGGSVRAETVNQKLAQLELQLGLLYLRYIALVILQLLIFVRTLQ